MTEHHIVRDGRTLRLRLVSIPGRRATGPPGTKVWCPGSRFWSISENGRQLDTALTLSVARRRARAIIEGGYHVID